MEYYNDFKNPAGVLTNTANWEANQMMCSNSQSSLIADTRLEKSCILFCYNYSIFWLKEHKILRDSAMWNVRFLSELTSRRIVRHCTQSSAISMILKILYTLCTFRKKKMYWCILQKEMCHLGNVKINHK